tara:strand:+ start:23789 stop:25213 length:1425 start_codon:yes stop_codon:yes gene_type:complete
MRFQVNKISIKSIGRITKRFPLFHKTLSNFYNFLIIYILPLKNINRLLSRKSKKELNNIIGKQTIKKIFVEDINLSTRESLLLSLDKLEIEEGGWCVYFKDAFKIIDYKFFPKSYKKHNIGIKILINEKNKIKNKNLSSYGLRPFGKLADIKEILRVGNRLSFLNLGPKIFDLILLEDNYGNKAFAYLLEDINGDKICYANKKEIKLFIKEILNDKWLQPSWNTTFLIDDFEINRESSNIILDKNNQYKFIDFQAFSIPNEFEFLKEIVNNSSETAFGRKRIFSDQNYLYQVLPEVQSGKRDTLKRWKLFDNLFESHDIKIENKIICDVGCNLGMNCYYSLSKGASYVYGIDKKNISKRASLLISSLGGTRFKFIGLDLKDNNDLEKIKFEISNQIDILFYCSIDGHIGYPSQIKDIMFKYILHEGHVGTTIEENFYNLLKNNWLNKSQSKIIFKTYLKDGDSGKRPIFLASRI